MTRKRRAPRICYLLRGNPPAKPVTPTDNTLPGTISAPVKLHERA